MEKIFHNLVKNPKQRVPSPHFTTTLKNCRLVCKAWNDEAFPQLLQQTWINSCQGFAELCAQSVENARIAPTRLIIRPECRNGLTYYGTDRFLQNYGRHVTSLEIKFMLLPHQHGTNFKLELFRLYPNRIWSSFETVMKLYVRHRHLDDTQDRIIDTGVSVIGMTMGLTGEMITRWH